MTPSAKRRREAFLTALLAFLIVGTYLAITERAGLQQQVVLQGDSLNYYRDALILQHRIFGHEGDEVAFVEKQFAELGTRVRGGTKVRFGRSLLPIIWMSTLLEISGGRVQIIYMSYLLMAALAAALGGWTVGWTFGRRGGAAYLVALMACTGDAVPTLLLEMPMLLSLTALAFSMWWLLSQPGRVTRFLVVFTLCIMGVFVKAPLQLFCLLAALTAGGALVSARWRGRGRSLATGAGAVGSVVLLLIVKASLSQLAIASLDVRPEIMNRSNGGYAIWIGSLPSKWTGAYSGRLGTSHYNHAIVHSPHKEFPDQHAMVAGNGFYWVPMRVALPLALRNYRAEPVDAIKRFTFRTTRMIRINGFHNPYRALVGLLALVGCAAILWRGCWHWLPWVLVYQGVMWMHGISRFRERDEEQLPILAAVLAAAGMMTLLKRPQDTSSEPVPHRAGRRLVLWGQKVAAMGCLAPLVLALLFPVTQSWSKPEVLVRVRHVLDSGAPALAFVIETGRPHQFVGVESKQSGKVWHEQTDETGRARLTIPIGEEGVVDAADTTVYAWSLTGRLTTVHQSDDRWTEED